MTKDDILAQLGQSWSNLQSALDGLPDDRLSDPGVSGTWSAKDVLGHIAFWDRYSAAHPQPEADTDWQILNDQDHAAKADWSPDRIRTELAAAHDAILIAYRALPTLDPDHVKEDWEHYDEHAAEIRAWRDREGI